MPTELGQPYSVTWRGRYPHLLPEDKPTWEKFMDTEAGLFERFYYDVRVGGPDLDTVPTSNKWAKLFYTLKAYRIDVVGEKADELWLIEVTGSAGIRSLGQCIAYPLLYSKDPVINKPVLPVLLAHSIDFDIKWCCDQQGIRVVLV